MLQVKQVVDIDHRGMQKITTVGKGEGIISTIVAIVECIYICGYCNINTDLKPQRNRETQHRAYI
jgi:hypothetical protein